ncbi:hypothetical protein GCM10007928_38440 [Sulfitobacter porphyrae]|nr:hypothetical protein GCM10007928_38440 [Sulfitobacter porphyrae]
MFQKARFWETYGTTNINDRQRDIHSRLQDGIETAHMNRKGQLGNGREQKMMVSVGALAMMRV